MNFLLPKLALLLSFLAHFPSFFSKIDRFENPLRKIDMIISGDALRVGSSMPCLPAREPARARGIGAALSVSSGSPRAPRIEHRRGQSTRRSLCGTWTTPPRTSREGTSYEAWKSPQHSNFLEERFLVPRRIIDNERDPKESRNLN